MNSKLLTLLFTIGSFLAVTPPVVMKKKRFLNSKIYILSVSFLLTIGVIASLICKNFYLEYMHIKTAVSLLEELLLYSLNMYLLIIMTLRKEDEWRKIYKTLEATRGLVQKRGIRIPYYTGFLFATTIHFGVSAYEITVWSEIDGSEYFRDNLLSHFQIYLKFFYIFLLCVLTNMLLSRYKGLKSYLLLYIEENSGYQIFKFPNNFIMQTKNTMFVLKKTVNLYNEMFGSVIFLIVSYTTVQMINYIHYAIYDSKEFTVTVSVMFLNFCYVGWTFLCVAVLVILCDLVEKEAEIIVFLSFDLRILLTTRLNKNHEIEDFTKFLIDNTPTFSAADFFTVGNITLLQILGNICTFLIVMIQFEK